MDIVGRQTFSTLAAALPPVEGPVTVYVPIECTDIRTVAKESCILYIVGLKCAIREGTSVLEHGCSFKMAVSTVQIVMYACVIVPLLLPN